MVLGAKEKFELPAFLNDLLQDQSRDSAVIHACEIDETDFYVGSYATSERTRAFLKVQDGCDYPCTYCTIPMARGISRSDTLENVINNAREIAAQDIKENCSYWCKYLVITVKGEYGNKRHEHTFLELIQALDKVEGIARLRISSIEPNLLSNDTIAFVSKSKKLCSSLFIYPCKVAQIRF